MVEMSYNGFLVCLAVDMVSDSDLDFEMHPVLDLVLDLGLDMVLHLVLKPDLDLAMVLDSVVDFDQHPDVYFDSDLYSVLGLILI